MHGRMLVHIPSKTFVTSARLQVKTTFRTCLFQLKCMTRVASRARDCGIAAKISACPQKSKHAAGKKTSKSWEMPQTIKIAWNRKRQSSALLSESREQQVFWLGLFSQSTGSAFIYRLPAAWFLQQVTAKSWLRFWIISSFHRKRKKITVILRNVFIYSSSPYWFQIPPNFHTNGGKGPHFRDF